MTVALPDRPLRLGTRASPLAMRQAEMTRDALIAVHGWAEGAVELVPMVAAGDRLLDRALAEVGGKALWTRELDRALGEHEVDACVHSMKDVETLRPDAFAMAAMLPRADVRDRLVGANSIADLRSRARVGTSSPRRSAQLLRARADLTIVLLRGNVATRLNKLATGEAEATLLAAAGLERLGLHDIGVPLDCDDWLPAPQQGAIGIECRADDAATQRIVSAIDHCPTSDAIAIERALLAALGGDCRSPIAALAQETADGGFRLRAQIFSLDGQDMAVCDAVVRDAADAADAAAAMLGSAPDVVRRLFAGPMIA